MGNSPCRSVRKVTDIVKLFRWRDEARSRGFVCHVFVTDFSAFFGRGGHNWSQACVIIVIVVIIAKDPPLLQAVAPPLLSQ